MKSICRIFFLVGLTLAFFSCKNETKETVQEQEVIPVVEKKVLTPKEKDQVNSVLAKAMVTPEIKTFVGMLVSSGLTDVLMNEQGPFTVIAPSNEAFNALDKTKMSFLLNPVNREAVISLLKSHIVSGNLDSATLVKNIKSSNGSYKVISLSGITYNATREGTDIVLTSTQGVKAIIGKSDIIGSNGVLHVLNAILGMN
jgi:uncharacterized surface protein with fasciclin (FAS1) repeats